MDLTAHPARSWRKTVNLLLDEVDNDGPIFDHPLARREMERMLLTQLLLAQPSNYSELLRDQQPRGTAPRAIRRAAGLIEDHAAELLTVEDIAEYVGLGVRALQEGFRRYLDTAPMNYLREVRLRRVREELAAADPASTTVTETAIRWGFPKSWPPLGPVPSALRRAAVSDTAPLNRLHLAGQCGEDGEVAGG